MKKWLTAIVCSIILLVGVGCNELLTGVGIGVAGTETVDAYEEQLTAKRGKLLAEYDKAIEQMSTAGSTEELSLAKQKADQMQIALAANQGALAIVGELKKDEPTSSTDVVTIGLGILSALGANEFRKRRGYEKAIGKLEAEALPEIAANIEAVVKSSTKILG